MDASQALLYGLYPLSAYLIGSLPFGYLVARWAKGVDIRECGSGNIGATNVGRVLGWRYGVLVLALDAAKGYGPVALAGPLLGATDALAPVLAGLAGILGHLAPVYLRFQGGKGVATAAGVFAALAPRATGVALLVWLGCAGLFRFVSLASIAAAVTLPLAFAGVEPGAFGTRVAVFWLCVLTSLLVVVRHRSNLRRLWTGVEPRIGEGKK
ncbi:MAG: glycerol-3-phosphate 1-O-acyltransferase PlsY [Planctomycetes bacterium]|nr:glycerol-3-phosphate 1-O-acyltransferase PlsY [Planctomycetota bacterium]